MGKKKFIDKKNSATFHLLARDTGDNYLSGETSDDFSGDRVFVRVDNSPYQNDNLFDSDKDENDKFADSEKPLGKNPGGYSGENCGGLSESVRREILELGFADDGYNYLLHMRDIKNNGAGSYFYENTKAKLYDLPNDVKAYDASKVEIARVSDEFNEKSIYTVASKSVGMRIQKAVDPEVAALLDDSDLSRLASDDEELEEDFVIQANLPDEVDIEEFNNKLSLAESSRVNEDDISKPISPHPEEDASEFGGEIHDNEKPRVRRYLDEQFDMLEFQEYGSDSEDEFDYFAPEEEDSHVSLVEKLGPTFRDHVKKEIELDDHYKAPADLLHEQEDSENTEPVVSATVVLQRCKEYAENYDEQEEVPFLEEESSDDAEIWDCETVVSTYSNLDNHPGKIGVPNARRKKKPVQTVSGPLGVSNNIITLKGKAMLPIDYLPNSKKAVTEKVKEVNSLGKEQQKRKQHGQESKEEKKERKSAVKEERREARRVKKETKEIYKSEGHQAQKVAAFTGPSTIHLM